MPAPLRGRSIRRQAHVRKARAVSRDSAGTTRACGRARSIAFRTGNTPESFRSSRARDHPTSLAAASQARPVAPSSMNPICPDRTVLAARPRIGWSGGPSIPDAMPASDACAPRCGSRPLSKTGSPPGAFGSELEDARARSVSNVRAIHNFHRFIHSPSSATTPFEPPNLWGCWALLWITLHNCQVPINSSPGAERNGSPS